MDMVADTRNAVKCELAFEVAQSFGAIQLEVTGGSMLPAVWPGDRIYPRDVSHHSAAA